MIKKIFSEPLVHFAILGLAMFFMYSLVSNDDTDRKIIIDQYDLNEIIAKWNLQWSRDPTDVELKGLLDGYIKQEIYYREAVAMRLDHNDEVVKRRMAQKMKFLTQDIASQVEPSEQELKRYLEANQDLYIKEKEVSFSHIYFSPDKRQNALSDAQKALTQSSPKGDHPPIPSLFDLAPLSKVRANFGQEFAEDLNTLNVKTSWQGPLQSGYGTHIVMITKVSDPRPYAFQEVKEKLQNDYQYNFQMEMNDELFNSLIDKYEVVLAFEEEE